MYVIMEDQELLESYKKYLEELTDRVKEMQQAGISQKEIDRFVSASWRKERKRLGISHTPRFLKGLYMFLLISGVATLVLIGVANGAFPKGAIHHAGTPDYWHDPSPLSNPIWVRFLQDHTTIMILVGIAVICFSAYMIWERSKQ